MTQKQLDERYYELRKIYEDSIIALEKEQKTILESCLHTDINDSGVFGQECNICGKFWPGAF